MAPDWGTARDPEKIWRSQQQGLHHLDVVCVLSDHEAIEVARTSSSGAAMAGLIVRVRVIKVTHAIKCRTKLTAKPVLPFALPLASIFILSLLGGVGPPL